MILVYENWNYFKLTVNVINFGPWVYVSWDPAGGSYVQTYHSLPQNEAVFRESVDL